MSRPSSILQRQGLDPGGVETRAELFGRAAIGAVLWAVGCAFLRPGWIETLLLFAPLVIVPLGLQLRGGLPARYPWLRLTAAFLLVPSLVIDQGTVAALLSIPWLISTLPLAAAAAIRRGEQWRSLDAGFLFDAGRIFLAIGAAGLVVQRAGLQPMALPHIINLLFALHYHYAGFGLSTLAGALAMSRDKGRLETLAGLGAVSAVLLLACAIGFADWLAPAGAVWMGTAGAAIAALQIRRATEVPVGVGSALLMASGLAGIGAMGLGAAYGLREIVPFPWLTIPWMAAVHGTLNAFGFVLGGLVGWTVVQRQIGSGS